MGRGTNIAVELFITCQREDCGRVVAVRDRRMQRLRKYCSLSCSAIQRNRNPAAFLASSRGAKERVKRERARLMEEVRTMSPIEAFRIGYTRGLYSKRRQQRAHRRRQRIATKAAA